MTFNGKMKNIYLYARFERLWHWLQTLLIIILLLTGFEVNGAFTLVGFGSALSGTGGPLLLLPVLLFLKAPVLASIGLAQVIQIPVAATATIANLQHNPPQLLLSAVIGVGLVAGSLAGANLAHRLPVKQLQRLLASGLTAMGAVLLAALIGS